MNPFQRALGEAQLTLLRTRLRVLQVNLGRYCNLSCAHCHVSAGPKRTETMSAQVAERVEAWVRAHRPAVVDLTGGAPEAAPEFHRILRAGLESGARVMVRTNLVVLVEPEGQRYLDWLCSGDVHLVASLPCYGKANVDTQRGEGTFERSIQALCRLNALGFGVPGGKPLDLVYNPLGGKLPPPEGELGEAYREVLRRSHGVEFTRLFCITNMPIGRFAGQLRRAGELEEYQALLERSFSPGTVEHLMCRDTLSVDWEGRLYDCDFNQMVGLGLSGRLETFLWDVAPSELPDREIATASHCFGCTAGAGSSCGGALVTHSPEASPA